MISLQLGHERLMRHHGPALGLPLVSLGDVVPGLLSIAAHSRLVPSIHRRRVAEVPSIKRRGMRPGQRERSEEESSRQRPPGSDSRPPATTRRQGRPAIARDRTGSRFLLSVPACCGTAVPGLRVTEVQPGEEISVGEVRIRAVPAAHDGRRLPYGPSRVPALSYILRGKSTRSLRVGSSCAGEGSGRRCRCRMTPSGHEWRVFQLA
jgi:hypothetical protein